MMKIDQPPLLFEGLRARVHRNTVRLDDNGLEIMLTEEASRALGMWLTTVTQERKSSLGSNPVPASEDDL